MICRHRRGRVVRGALIITQVENPTSQRTNDGEHIVTAPDGVIRTHQSSSAYFFIDEHGQRVQQCDVFVRSENVETE
jgi:hypothetical protein